MLSFWFSGKEESSNWGDHPERFESLMKTVSESIFKDSLQELVIYECCLVKNDCKLLMESLNMENVVIHDDAF